MNNQMKRIAHRSFADPKHLVASRQYHRRILEAIKAGDRVLAEQLTKERILNGLEVKEKLMKIAETMDLRKTEYQESEDRRKTRRLA